MVCKCLIRVITINCFDYCFCFQLPLFSDENFFKTFEYKVGRRNYNKHTIDLTIDGRNVRIILSRGELKRCDVCVVGTFNDFADHYIAEVKHQASSCKQQHPEAAVIVARRVMFKNFPPMLKHVELAKQNV